MRIFVTNDAYLPGYRFGGPVRSIANIVDWLGDEHQFYVFTKDRDLGDESAYDDVELNTWTSVGKARVFYASPAEHHARRALREIEDLRPDVVYLNGFWERMTRGLLARRVHGVRYVLAPRGALGAGALQIKVLKKRLGLLVMRPLLRDLVWHATADTEREEIGNVFGYREPVIVAANLLAQAILHAPVPGPNRLEGPCRLVSFSRVSRKKNFDYLLRVLLQCEGPFSLDIIGPIEDTQYYSELRDLAQGFDERQKVRFLGPQSPEQLAETLKGYDFFVFPTQHENYGHVIIEALAAGLPIVISDRTPWRELEGQGLGWDLPLDDQNKWVDVVNTCLNLELDSLMKMRRVSVSYARDIARKQPLEVYGQLFGAGS